MISSDDRVCAIGVRPLYPSVFWDYDLSETETELEGLQQLHYYMQLRGINTNGVLSRSYAIYKTQHGYHLIIRCRSWDEAQDMLMDMHRQWPKKQSILSCRRQRLRISPKWVLKPAPVPGHEEIGSTYRQEVNPAPLRIETNWAVELREGKEEFYETFNTKGSPDTALLPGET